MERNDLMSIINNLRNSFDDTENRENLLNQISDEISTLYDNTDTLTASNNEYINQNEQLRNANMKLFLQIGSDKPNNPPTPNPPIEEKQPEKLKYENLFNEKGELK